MRTIEVVYSPLCEATGAMIEKLRKWFYGTDIEIKVFPFQLCPQRLKRKYQCGENCFIDVFYEGERIDSVPLHQDKLYKILDISFPLEQISSDKGAAKTEITHEELMEALSVGRITFHPIIKSNYTDEMTMCLCNYPFGNPPKEYHTICINIKKQVFEEAWRMEDIAGVYAKYENKVIGLLEVFPREMLKKYGYMTGTTGQDKEYLSIGCYEIGYGIPRVDMIGLLMEQLHTLFPLFHRKYIEGIGIYDWLDGFNPYWVYEKFGFRQAEKLSENVIVMSKKILTQ